MGTAERRNRRIFERLQRDSRDGGKGVYDGPIDKRLGPPKTLEQVLDETTVTSFDASGKPTRKTMKQLAEERGK